MKQDVRFIKGHVEKTEEESAHEERVFTDDFYKLYHETRLMLIKEFEESSGDRLKAIHYAQMFLNRLMFIFFAKDKGLLDREILINKIERIAPLMEANSRYVSMTLTSLFESLDAGVQEENIFGFNGELFKEKIPANMSFQDKRNTQYFKDCETRSGLKKDAQKRLDESLILSKFRNASPLITNIALMATYDFTTEINVNILGHIFEQSITDLEKLREGDTSRRKKEGIFYTPEYIIDYICRNTIIPYLAEKNAATVEELIKEYKGNLERLEKKLKEIKILDPACGSGAFLVKAVDVLLEIHKAIIEAKETKGRYDTTIFGDREDVSYQSFGKYYDEDEARQIIENNIHGVDINEESVEITKLSLFLKIARKNKKLIDLDQNIKCGNSLIGPEFYHDKQTTLLNQEEQYRINVFDWNKEYPHKFDAVIGNPPYIQIQKLNEFYPQETEFIRDRYESATDRNVDIYIPFIQKATELLTEDGLLGFISPNRFFNSDYGEKIRDYLKKYNIYHIVNFRHYLVFSKADVYTCLLFVQNRKQLKTIKYKEIRGLYKTNDDDTRRLLTLTRGNLNLVIDEINSEQLSHDKWYFMTDEEWCIFNKILKYQPFKSLYREFFVGIQTSADKIYILKYMGENDKEYKLFSSQIQKEIWLEKNIIHPIIDNTNINSYYVNKPTEYVIFPYKIDGDKAILLTEKELENYPKTWGYIKENKKELEAREKGKFKGLGWYCFGRYQKIHKQHLPKLLIPHVVKTTVAAIDEKGEFYLDNVGANGIILKPEIRENQDYFLAILNNPLTSFFISKISIFLSGGYYASNKQFASLIPIRRIDFNNLSDKAYHDKVVSLVSQMLDLHKRLASANTPDEKTLIQRRIDAADEEINKIVYRLYGLTPEEIQIIEETIKK